jgi:hypothetical protein
MLPHMQAAPFFKFVIAGFRLRSGRAYYLYATTIRALTNLPAPTTAQRPSALTMQDPANTFSTCSSYLSFLVPPLIPLRMM